MVSQVGILLIALKHEFFKDKYLHIDKQVNVKMTVPNLSPEYFEVLQKEYEYVSYVLSFATQRFSFLVNQSNNASLLQQSINDLALRKTTLEVQLYALKDFLEK